LRQIRIDHFGLAHAQRFTNRLHCLVGSGSAVSRQGSVLVFYISGGEFRQTSGSMLEM
jgi:hypothetical protein